jgi:hypothetical protein
MLVNLRRMFVPIVHAKKFISVQFEDEITTRLHVECDSVHFTLELHHEEIGAERERTRHQCTSVWK